VRRSVHRLMHRLLLVRRLLLALPSASASAQALSSLIHIHKLWNQ
jgi:hypothetical protein